MVSFLIRRTGVMLLTALCLTFCVFFLTNLEPNLEKLTKSEGNVRMTDVQVQSWLEKNGYRQPLFKRYGEWLGVAPGGPVLTKMVRLLVGVLSAVLLQKKHLNIAASFKGTGAFHWYSKKIFSELLKRNSA